MKSLYAGPAAKNDALIAIREPIPLFQRKFDVLFGFSRNKTVLPDDS